MGYCSSDSLGVDSSPHSLSLKFSTQKTVHWYEGYVEHKNQYHVFGILDWFKLPTWIIFEGSPALFQFRLGSRIDLYKAREAFPGELVYQKKTPFGGILFLIALDIQSCWINGIAPSKAEVLLCTSHDGRVKVVSLWLDIELLCWYFEGKMRDLAFKWNFQMKPVIVAPKFSGSSERVCSHVLA